MHLVRWFRKNRMKLMAVVIIVLMFGFVGGSYLHRLGRTKSNIKTVVAFYKGGRKITNSDLAEARLQLNILQRLHVNIILANSQDLNGIILAELLFSDSGSSQAARRLKQLMRMGDFQISDKQINDIYRRSLPTVTYWTLLKNEAEQAGITIPKEQARNYLIELIPHFLDGATYSQIMTEIVNRQGIPEDKALEAFGRLLAVLQYSRIICSNENTTLSEQIHTLNQQEQSINAEFTRFSAELFADEQPEPTEEQILKQFDKYKKFLAGRVNEENPYGFGYRLPDRVRLEYLAVRLDEFADIAPQPTQEQTEQYYHRNIDRYTEQVPSDPNDPNSPPVKRTKTYAEVADDIFTTIQRIQIANKAGGIMQQAKEIIETTTNYETAANQLSKQYKINVYVGRTGFLSAEDVLADEYLTGLFLEGYGHNPPSFVNFVRLVRIIFSIKELDAAELGPFDVPKPAIGESLGPLKDMLGNTMMIVRIQEAHKSDMPDKLEYCYNKKGVNIKQTPAENTNGDLYCVRQKVIEDIKKLEGLKTAKTEAEQFIADAQKNGWAVEIEKLNKKFKKAKQTEPASVNDNSDEPFKLEKLTGLKEIPTLTMEAVIEQAQGNPTQQPYVNEMQKERLLFKELFSVIPADSNSIDSVPVVIEIKPEMCCYCLKDISIKKLEQDRYVKIKAERTHRDGIVLAQSLAAVHFNPDNIARRMNFRSAERPKEAADANEPSKSSG